MTTGAPEQPEQSQQSRQPQQPEQPEAAPQAAGGARSSVLPRWSLTRSIVAAALSGAVFAAAGLLASRVDLALLGLPFVLAAAWAWDGRPGDDAESHAEALVEARARDGRLHYTVRFRLPQGVESVAARFSTHGGEAEELLIGARSAGELHGTVPLLHSGPQELLRLDYRLHGIDGSVLGEGPEGEGAGGLSVTRTIPASYHAISALPLPRRLQGLTGGHDSARPGDGGDFRDIHPFSPGDRLRRIDWKATARRGRFAGDLYVRRTTATSDATVVVVLDSRDDVGEQIAEWSRNTAAIKGLGSLDVAREAAGSIAAGYIRAGDRVGFQDLASQRRMVSHGAGSRHLQRLLRDIESSAPSGAPAFRQRPPVVAPGALIYVLSTFLDDEAARMAGQWRAVGHRVIAVDVLPAARFLGATREERIAHRIVMMERADRIRGLEARGIGLLRWQGEDDASREAALRALSRDRPREARR